MEESQQLPQLHIIVLEAKEAEAVQENETTMRRSLLFDIKSYNQWWLHVIGFTVFLICGQSAGTLLGRLYLNEGRKSKWLAALVQPAGFPILLIPLSSPIYSQTPQITSLYFCFLDLIIGGILMASVIFLSLLHSLICATQLAFNEVFSFFINSQKFTALILNSVVLLTTSAALLVVGVDTSDPKSGSDKGKFITIGGCASYALVLSITQHLVQKVLKRVTLASVLERMIFQSMAAACVCAIGLFASGEWKDMGREMQEYGLGKVSYVMTLVWTAIAWQVYIIGSFGLIFQVSSLFSNVISVLALPIVPILAVIFFNDKMNGVKVVAMLLAVWGFVSYISINTILMNSKSKTVQASVDGS